MGDMSKEPSMEEILSSIRRVMAREDAETETIPARKKKAIESPTEEPFPMVRMNEEDVMDDVDDVLELSAMNAAADDSPLVSDSSVAAARDSLNALSQAAALTRPAPKPDMAVGGSSLDAMVRDMIRPMLKEWLDANLPHIVEDMVADEIARIARKRG